MPELGFAQIIKLNVNGVQITASKSEVLRRLGKPVSSRVGGIVPCSDGSTRRTIRYPGLVLRLEANADVRDFGVYEIDVTSPKWLVSGLRIGTQKRNVIKKFGHGRVLKENGKSYLAYFIEDGYASFHFKKNRLVKLSWEFNFC